MRDLKTENQLLREELAERQRQDRERDMATVRAQIAAQEAAREEEQKRHAAAVAKARNDELEKQRRDAWLNFRIDEARAGGNDRFAQFLAGDIYSGVPIAGWPPGSQPLDYEVALPGDAAEHDSPLAAALRRVGMTI